ncbi:hypothetical protein [Microbacterium sp. YY-01]|uniref:hypothetical protein n=1 Tax=Microbacterium sp. YY-01 TaxID=3421634 RepID=UPI003D175A30
MAEKRQIERRTVLKGAAWAAPVVAAAVATPAHAANSVEVPDCPDCFKPALGLGILPGAFTAQAVRLPGSSRHGTVAVLFEASIDATNCVGIFDPAYVIAGVSAVLTMSDGNSYTSTIGAAAGAGTLRTISALVGEFNFTGVELPNGGGFNIGGIGIPYKPRPTSITVFPLITLQAEIGIPPIKVPVDCNPALTWNLNGEFGIGGMTGLGGTVNYTGTATPQR